MDVSAFIQRHPRLFHMAEAGSWPSIARHGLMSTTALLDHFEVQGDARFAIESTRRPHIVTIEHPKHGVAQVRDNKPMREQFLAACLDGITLQAWYRELNRRVFLWVQQDRLDRLLNARAYRSRAHDILTIDTRKLLDRHLKSVQLTHINTGSTLYPSAPPRGAHTFVPLVEYDLDGMIRRRGRKDAIVECTVEYAIPDVHEITLEVARTHYGREPIVIWHSDDGKSPSRLPIMP